MEGAYLTGLGGRFEAMAAFAAPRRESGAAGRAAAGFCLASLRVRPAQNRARRAWGRDRRFGPENGGGLNGVINIAESLLGSAFQPVAKQTGLFPKYSQIYKKAEKPSIHMVSVAKAAGPPSASLDSIWQEAEGLICRLEPVIFTLWLR
jgi:hypothetical protein